MKTTINIDDSLVEQAMKLYKVRTKTRIIELGLEELIRSKQSEKLANAFGSQPEIEEPRRRR